MPSTTQKTHFRTLQSVDSEFSPNKFTLYESSRTGMQVVVVDQKGPKVVGSFVFGTEIHDDSGAPHTLEHLCFMGSKSYPYAEVLDKLASRAYSDPNAETDNEFTLYTVNSAGWAGFSNVLPVYLDHLIRPNLTDAACCTEVYHVDGSGHEGGVVFSEMQALQNRSGEVMTLKAQRTMYPEGTGFRYNTAGLLNSLRILTPERIRQFHRDMYQPRNLCLIIVGEVDTSHLLNILDDFESTSIYDLPPPDAPFKRPWVDSKPAPQLKESTVEVVEFPEEDESSGEILIWFSGPSCTDTMQISALAILLYYLAGSSVSVLENILVEREHLASTVWYSTTLRPSTLIEFYLSGVDSAQSTQARERVFQLLKETADKELDMSYISDCITRERRQQKFYSESSETFFTEGIINRFLFDKRDGSYLKDMASLSMFDELELWTDFQWRRFLRTWMSSAPSVTVIGKPSLALSKNLKDEEDARIVARKEKLGASGLKKLERELETAKTENAREIPHEILEKFDIPDTSSIHFINTMTARSGHARNLGQLHNTAQQIIDHDPSKLPLFIQFEHVQTNFVHIYLTLGTELVPTYLRPLLCVYLENFFNSPIVRDGERLEFEQSIVALEKDTVGYTMQRAYNTGMPEALELAIQVESNKYEAAISWIRDLLWNGIFDTERIKAATAKLLANIPEEKRDGDDMTRAVETMVHYAPEGLLRAQNTLVKALYLKRIKALLETEPDTVISQLQEIRNAICQFSNFRVLVIVDIERLYKPVSSWQILTELSAIDVKKPLIPIESSLQRLSAAGKKLGGLSYVIPLRAIDSSFAVLVAKGLESHQHPSAPALVVAIELLDGLSGPMFKAVRGNGLAYGTNFERRTNSGHVAFTIYRSPDASKAFETSKATVKAYASGETPIDSLELEGVISQIVLRFANNEATITAAAEASFIRQVAYGLPSNWNDELLKRLRNVTVEDIRNAIREFLLPLFNPDTADLIVVCASMMEERSVKGFEAMGFKPEVRGLNSFQDDYGLKADGVEEETDDDEEDEDGEDDDEEGEDDDEEGQGNDHEMLGSEEDEEMDGGNQTQAADKEQI